MDLSELAPRGEERASDEPDEGTPRGVDQYPIRKLSGLYTLITPKLTNRRGSIPR